MRPPRESFHRIVPNRRDPTLSAKRALYFLVGCSIAGDGFYLLHLKVRDHSEGLTAADGFTIGGVVLFGLTMAFGDRVLRSIARAYRQARGR